MGLGPVLWTVNTVAAPVWATGTWPKSCAVRSMTRMASGRPPGASASADSLQAARSDPGVGSGSADIWHAEPRALVSTSIESSAVFEGSNRSGIQVVFM
jgi:hypothetical protein